jgi:predicted ATPase/DNA-binding winged helix-turn-helix (wHTH) protein
MSAAPGPVELARIRIRIGISADRRTLWVDGQPAIVGARAFDLLLALVERRDRVVGKNELLEVVWPRLVVEAANLHVQISTLRKLLGPSCIATIPGRGYRFTAVLDEDSDGVEVFATVSKSALEPIARVLTNLPAERPLLYGRDADVLEVVQLLGQYPLVSIVGPGGIGKTRLSHAVAHEMLDRFGDGVWLIELAALSDAARVTATVAQALKMTVGDEAEALDAMVDAMRGKRVLLIFDNCEHLLDAVSDIVASTRRGAPSVKVLVTSQEPLKIADEHVFRLGALPIPEFDTLPEPGAALEYGAVALFVARAEAADPHFAVSAGNVGAILEICRRLDGVALALEFAAARVAVLGLEGLRARLNERFNIMSGGNRIALRRHQTLRAALEWSHALLTDAEQAVFRRLSVFAGGFALEAAQQVAADEEIDRWKVLEHLAALVDKSLVVVDSGDSPRYRMLETNCIYAAERLLATGEEESTACRHASYFAALFEAAWAERWNEAPTYSFGLLQPDLDNLRAALAWSNCNGPGLEMALAGVAARFWMGSGLDAEGIAACERAISNVATTTAPTLEARVLSELAQLGWYVLPLQRALQALERAIFLYRSSSDAVGLYLALARKAGFLASGGDIEGARRALAEVESLEAEAWPSRLQLERLIACSRVAWFDTNLEGFWAAHEARHRFACHVGNERDRLLARGNLVNARVALGQLDEAVSDGRELVDQFRRHGLAGTYLGYLLAHLAMAFALLGAVNDAVSTLREAAPALRAGAVVWRVLDLFALIAALRGRTANAARLFGAGEAIFERRGRRREVSLDRLHNVVAGNLRATLSQQELASLLSEGAAINERDTVLAALTELASDD